MAQATADLKACSHWEDAARVDAAVIRYGSTGNGDVLRVPGRHVIIRLRVSQYRVVMFLAPRQRTIYLLHVFRRS